MFASPLDPRTDVAMPSLLSSRSVLRLSPAALLAAVSLSIGCVPPYVELQPRAPIVSDPDVVRATFTFDGVGKNQLFARSVRPAGDTKAVLVVMHGLEDHSGRYAELADTLAKRGIAFYAFDLRGHGRSAGVRVWVDRFDDYVDDLATFIAEVKRREGKVPLFLLGHSMGGAIATLYAMRSPNELAGLVLSAPALHADVSGFEKGATRAIDAIMPEAGVFQLDLDEFSRSPEVVRQCKADALVYRSPAPAHTAVELIDALDRIEASMEQVSVPLLTLHGTADLITSPEGSKALVKRAASKDKKLVLYPGLVHDLLHEPEKARVLADITTWLDAHLGSSR